MNAIQEFRSALGQLKLDAGNPSYREIARRTRNHTGHAEVHKIFTSPRVPTRWDPHLSSIVAALNGDMARMFRIWQAAWLAQEGREAGPSVTASRVVHGDAVILEKAAEALRKRGKLASVQRALLAEAQILRRESGK